MVDLAGKHKQTKCIWTKKHGRIIRHGLMELTRNSIAALAILVGPFSGLIERGTLNSAASSLKLGSSHAFRRAFSSISLSYSFSALVSAFFMVGMDFLRAMLDWGRPEVAMLSSSQYFIYLFGCLTGGSWPLHPGPKLGRSPFSHSH